MNPEFETVSKTSKRSANMMLNNTFDADNSIGIGNNVGVKRRRMANVRKSPISISLKTFITALVRILCNIGDDQQYAHLVGSIVLNMSNKIVDFKFNVDKNSYYWTLSREKQRELVLDVLIALNDDMDKAQIERKFSIEGLKYFLATYKTTLNLSDFQNVNKETTKTSIKSAVGLRDVFSEYSKSITQFIASLSKCDSEMDMIKLIFELDLELPNAMYNFIGSINPIKAYVEDKPCPDPESHWAIPITTTKRTYVVITKYVKLFYNGNSFSLPIAASERDFNLLTTTAITSTTATATTTDSKSATATTTTDTTVTAVDPIQVPINRNDAVNRNDYDEYLIVDVLCTTKPQIIDVLHAPTSTHLSDDYLKRLAYASSLEYNTVSYEKDEAAVALSNGNYLFLAKNGIGKPVYMQQKLITTAVVGRCGRQAVIAFRDANDDLIIRGMADVTPCVNMLIMSRLINENIKTITETTEPYVEILLNGKTKKVFNTQNIMVKFFHQALLVSMKDINKLGSPIASGTDGKVSSINEVRVPAAKESLAIQITPEMVKNKLFLQMVLDTVYDDPQAFDFLRKKLMVGVGNGFDLPVGI